MPQRATTILDDAEASKYIWGVGFHWYETWKGGEPLFENVAKVQSMYPEKNLFLTEASIDDFDYKKVQLWSNAERYGKSMINDFNNGTVGWTDWNILLDENGGPNHVGNFCYAPVHFNTETKELIYSPIYYYIGHFSKFIKKNARRVTTSVTSNQILATTFVNPDKSAVSVVMNESTKEQTFWFCVDNAKMKQVTIPANSILTLIY